MKPEIIVALDTTDARLLHQLLQQLPPEVSWFKVGLELFSARGPDAISGIRSRRPGAHLMLDLKLHDIPHTVGRAVRALSPLQPDILTVHAAGGTAMLRTAREAAARHIPRCRIAAVTVLTSLDHSDLSVLAPTLSPSRLVLSLAGMARRAGIDTFVCSVAEAPLLRNELGPDMVTICPGIRPPGSSAADQKRIATPHDAVRAGADFVVVGRCVTSSPNPAAACRTLLQQLAAAGGPRHLR